MLYEILQLRFFLNMVDFTKKKWQKWQIKIPEKYDWKVKAFLLFLYNTKSMSIDVSFDNRNNFWTKWFHSGPVCNVWIWSSATILELSSEPSKSVAGVRHDNCLGFYGFRRPVFHSSLPLSCHITRHLCDIKILCYPTFLGPFNDLKCYLLGPKFDHLAPQVGHKSWHLLLLCRIIYRIEKSYISPRGVNF